MRFVPPPNAKKKVSVLISLIFATIPLSSYAFDISYPDLTFEWNDKTEATFDELNITINPQIQWNYYTINADNGKTFTVNNKTYVRSTSEGYIPADSEIAVYTFHAKGKNSVIDLHGDIDAISIEDVTVPNNQPYAGVNLFYAQEGGTINIGSPGSTVKAWVLAKKPDLISAKNGGKVHIKSLSNQLVGSIDMLDMDSLGTMGSEVTGVFSGSDSFWFGDDQSMMNLLLNVEAKFLGGSTIFQVMGKNEINEIMSYVKQFMDVPGNEITDDLNLEFRDGAQWTYFGFSQNEGPLTFGNEMLGAVVSAETVTKRISSIKLNGGIINLFDGDIRKKWEEIGLSKLWPELKDIEHDYVRIGNLKGNGGIFRLDLKSDEPSNSDEPSQSDMIFIESSEPGQHFIEPYRPEDLTSVSDTNRLTFALTAKDANSVSFADKQNIYGNSLFDYELIIDHERIDKKKQELIDKIEDLVGNYETFDDFDIEDYYDGTHWFIKRLLTKESAASIGMRSAGYASYDLAVNMDRRDRRLQNADFQNEEKDGLWARVQYGEAGAEHLYNADLTTVYVGYEKATSTDNRLGFSFAYTDGESDLNDLKGSGDLKRYEASVYDTLTFGSHYLDFVARFGQVDNEFDVTNQSGALTTTGSFDQKYAALSAEYGYNFKDEHNVFIEPQVQLQVAYLGDYNYRTERNMKVDADSDISVIGRVGLRTGKTFESSDYVGELYARADVLHQFTDGQDAQFSDLSDKVNVTWGNKDTWSTFGVGGYLNWKDNMSFQVDVERTAGGETIDTWLVSGRVNYLF